MAHVADLWHRRDRASGELRRTARYGKGKRWLAKYLAPDGRERSRTFERKVDAERFLATVEADKLRGTYVDPDAGRDRFKTYAEHWLSVQVIRGNTTDLYRSRLDNHVLPVLGDRPLAAIKRSNVQGFVKDLEQKGLAASTIEGVYGMVATIFRSAVEDEKLPRTPCRNIALPERFDKLVVPLPLEKVLALTGHVRERYRAAIIVAYTTGLRQGEVFGLQVDRVDFLRRQVRIEPDRGQLVKLKTGARIGPPKTKASARVVPLPDIATAALAEHMRCFAPVDSHFDGCKPGRCVDGCTYGVIFTNNVGKPLSRSVFNPHVWQKAVAKVGLPSGTGFHELRHFYASVLIAGGESVKVVQKRLGHKDATETLNTYTHLWPESEERTRKVVDEALRPADEQRSATESGAE